MLTVRSQLVTVLLGGLVMVVVVVHSAAEEGGEKKAWACFGNFHNFLDINCPQDHQVELLTMMNGAKPTNQNCPPVTTDDDNFRADCCSFTEGDCVIQTHPINFPVECSERPFCRPQSRLADTGPTCNSKNFPKFTHYTEITYRCIVHEQEHINHNIHDEEPTSPSGTPPTATESQDKKTTNGSSGQATSDVTNDVNTAQPRTKNDGVEKRDDFTPAMVGGMITGIVGLILTILIFMFYWGRKRQIRISGKNQSNVWDFLLSNTMSVRAFRGYDNFSSTNAYTSRDGSGGGVSAGGGSPGSSPPGMVRRKAMWLPNISMDSGQGHSNVTSDDNCSVVTVERHLGEGAAGKGDGRRRDRDDGGGSGGGGGGEGGRGGGGGGGGGGDGGESSASASVDPVGTPSGGGCVPTSAAAVADDSGGAGHSADIGVGGDGGGGGGGGSRGSGGGGSGGGDGGITVKNVRNSPDPETGVEATNLMANNL